MRAIRYSTLNMYPATLRAKQYLGNFSNLLGLSQAMRRQQPFKNVEEWDMPMAIIVPQLEITAATPRVGPSSRTGLVCPQVRHAVDLCQGLAITRLVKLDEESK